MRLPIQVDAGGGEGGGAGGAQVTMSFELLSNKFTLPVRDAIRPKVAIGAAKAPYRFLGRTQAAIQTQTQTTSVHCRRCLGLPQSRRRGRRPLEAQG